MQAGQFLPHQSGNYVYMCMQGGFVVLKQERAKRGTSGVAIKLLSRVLEPVVDV